MKQPRNRDATPTPGTRPPEYVIEAWVSEQLKDRIRRLGPAPAAPGRTGPQRQAPEPELEAEP
jgi:hypothetical protein